MTQDWTYNNLPSGEPYDWGGAWRGDHPDDNVDFHVDLGCGRAKKGRIGIDRHGDVDLLWDLETLNPIQTGFLSEYTSRNKLPFPDNFVESMISHHCLEHISQGFLPLMDECYRILKPGALFRIIVPLFPSLAAVTDPDHKRYFTQETFQSFVGEKKGAFWSDSFAEPYTRCRFSKIEINATPPQEFSLVNGFGDSQPVYCTHGGAESGLAKEKLSIDDLFKEPREVRVSLRK